MIFKNRKLYPHGQNKNIYLIQIPKVICDDLELKRDSKVCLSYDNKTMEMKLQVEE